MKNTQVLRSCKKNGPPKWEPVLVEASLCCGLENVTQAQLQYAGPVYVRSDVAEGLRHDDACPRIAKVDVIKYVERVGAELQFVTLPRHLEVLQQGQIQVPETRATENVTVPRTACDWARECRLSCGRVREVLDYVRQACTLRDLMNPLANLGLCADEYRGLSLRKVDRKRTRVNLER